MRLHCGRLSARCRRSSNKRCKIDPFLRPSSYAGEIERQFLIHTMGGSTIVPSAPIRPLRRACFDIFRGPTIHFPLTNKYKQIRHYAVSSRPQLVLNIQSSRLKLLKLHLLLTSSRATTNTGARSLLQFNTNATRVT